MSEYERAPYIATSLWYIAYETFEKKYRVYPGNDGWYGPFDNIDDALDHIVLGMRKQLENDVSKDRRNYRVVSENEA